MSRRQDLRILAAYANAPEFPEGNVLKQDGFLLDMRLENQEVRRLIITSVRNFFGK